MRKSEKSAPKRVRAIILFDMLKFERRPAVDTAGEVPPCESVLLFGAPMALPVVGRRRNTVRPWSDETQVKAHLLLVIRDHDLNCPLRHMLNVNE